MRFFHYFCVHFFAHVGLTTYVKHVMARCRRDELTREWDPHIPYGELGLQQAEASNGAALVIASGRAAERLWYRQNRLDEALASFGAARANDDEVELESELLHTYPRLTPEQLPEAKHTLEELAMRLLSAPPCWRAVETIAQALVQGVEQQPDLFHLYDVQKRIADAFAL